MTMLHQIKKNINNEIEITKKSNKYFQFVVQHVSRLKAFTMFEQQFKN